MAIIDSIIKTLKRVFKRHGFKPKRRPSSAKKRKKSKAKKKRPSPKSRSHPGARAKTRRKKQKSSKLSPRRLSRKSRSAKPKSKKILKPHPAKASLSKEDNKSFGPIMGEVTHYFSKIMVIVLKVKHGPLRVGQQVRIKGRSTDFSQVIRSLQIESVDVKEAKKGNLVGMKVKKEAKVGDIVYLI